MIPTIASWLIGHLPSLTETLMPWPTEAAAVRQTSSPSLPQGTHDDALLLSGALKVHREHLLSRHSWSSFSSQSCHVMLPRSKLAMWTMIDAALRSTHSPV